MDMKQIIAGRIADAAQASFENCALTVADVTAMLETPPDKKLGDYALPCFRLSKSLRKAPQQIAAALAQKSAGSISTRPASLFVSVPKVVTVGSSAAIEVSMLPDTAYASKIFQPWQGCRVSPDGRAEFTETGTAVFYVIPTLNDTIAQRVEVTVREETTLQAEDGTDMTFEDGTPIAI